VAFFDTTSLYFEGQGGATLALPWHFGSVPRNSAVAVRATMRRRWRSEQPGDDGAADFR
jgi:hypothetical protein